jgi:hypothetical protein
MRAREAAGMGFELELPLRPSRSRRALDRECMALERRWQQACERHDCALTAVAALRGTATPDSPVRIAAELRLAEARRRRHEIAEAIERLDVDFDDDL